MLFTSLEFLLLFLPIVWIGYILAIKRNTPTLAKVWLGVTSVFFYAWWNPPYVFLLLLSIGINYLVANQLNKGLKINKLVLIIGISFNILLLGIYKYYDFFISTINSIFGTDGILLHLLLPLGISFFTFQQIGYLVDTYRGETKEYRFLDYLLFVVFFPQLIAGPIVHHKGILPQFEKIRVSSEGVASGIFLFSLGFFKKRAIADPLSVWANSGYQLDNPSFIESWVTTLSYTFQLYFDFSGYSDMAIGLGLMFGILLPKNFDSPYRSRNLQEFWKRWHITLGAFFTQYVYIPLGGNRKGKYRTYFNLFMVFFLSGLWHGAGWTFILWGIMHGIGVVGVVIWREKGKPLPTWIAISMTFLYVHIAWILFRATNVQSALEMMKSLTGINGIWGYRLQSIENPVLTFHGTLTGILAAFVLLGILLVITQWKQNSYDLYQQFKPSWNTLIATSILVLYVCYLSFVGEVQGEFLYFNF